MKYEIINHGPDGSQYFQGCGVALTEFTECVTGCGSNAREAYEDAVEQVAQMHQRTAERLPTRPRGIRASDRVPAGAEDCYWYVSIRFVPVRGAK